MDLDVITADPAAVDRINRIVGEFVQCRYVLPPEICEPQRGLSPVLIDIDLDNADLVKHLAGMFQPVPRNGVVRIVVVDHGAPTQIATATSLSPTHILPRPIAPTTLFKALFGVKGPPAPRTDRPHQAVAQAMDANSKVFAHFFDNPDCPAGTKAIVEAASDELIDCVAKSGLSQWIEAVLSYHSATYRHCMLVNGIAVAFGQMLGFRRSDVMQLSVASAVHDIGKARVPILILDKPGRLTPEEELIVRRHPQHGLDMLKQANEFTPAVADVIIHHHEMLDGSGYPHGLKGADIPDLTQLVTISDIYSALIERRSYKAPLSPREAYTILQGMGGKLDQSLVEAFAPVVAACPEPTRMLAAS